MELVVKTFEELTNAELYELLRVRSEIFVVEQNCPYQDIDGKDYQSLHVFYKDEAGQVLACLRLFVKDTRTQTIQLGRVVTKEHGKGWGGKLLHEGMELAKSRLHAKIVYIEAQTYAIGYYAREGFMVTSEAFLEDGIPHVQMEWRQEGVYEK